MWNFLKRFNWSILSFAWLFVIFFLLFFDGRGLEIEQPRLFLHADKVVHAGLFGIWAFCLALASIQRSNYIRYIPILFAILLVAVSTELIQGLTNYRTSDHWDVLADMLGGIIGLFSISFFFKD